MPTLSETPAHQKQNKERDLKTHFHENTSAKEEDWNYIDQGRNWGQECQKGMEQSPIDIPGLITADQEPDARFTIRFGMTTPTPAVTIDVNDNHFWIEAGAKPLATTVVHVPEDPDSALSFNLVRVAIKSPSEHTINLQHQPLELQFEHDLDLNHSYIRPALAAMGVAQKLVVSALIEVGAEHEFLAKVLEKIPEDSDPGKGPIEIKADLEEGKPPLFQILGSSFVPNSPMGFSYAAYKGSLSVPPCTENTQWVVLQKPITASPEQIQAIDRLHNIKLSRALQRTNRRPITHGQFHSANINTAMSKSSIKKPWFGVNPANMVVPQFKPLKKQ